MLFFYNLSTTVLVVLALPLLLPALLFARKLRKGLRERLGFYSRGIRETLQEMPRPRVWIHAASMGEVSAILPIARILRERNPNIGLVISTTTLTGLNLAKSKLAFASAFILLPLDFFGAVRRALNLIEPNLLVIAETELWPNLLLQVKQRGCQLALVNGRLSGRSLKRYQWVRGLTRQMLDQFDLLIAQSAEDGERFRSLGANAQRLKVIGNVKFDAVPGGQLGKLRADLRLESGHPVWVAGSTRPGEEEIILEAFQKVLSREPRAVLILAPRHLERLGEVEQLLVKLRLGFSYRSRVAQELLNFPVILLDTMGELADAYGLGQAAFVGGSLMPFGGHNPLEPAALGVAVLLGQHTEHFAEVAHLLLENNGAKVVRDSDELASSVIRLLGDREFSRAMGAHAREVVTTFHGTALKTVELLQKLMLIKRWAGEVRNWRAESQQNHPTTNTQEVLPDDWPKW